MFLGKAKSGIRGIFLKTFIDLLLECVKGSNMLTSVQDYKVAGPFLVVAIVIMLSFQHLRLLPQAL